MVTLGLTAAASAPDAGIYKKNIRSETVTLVTTHEEMSDIRKRVKSLKECGLWIKGVNKYIKN